MPRIRNPFEVRAGEQLEAVFADEDDAAHYAHEISEHGARDVRVIKRPPRLHPALVRSMQGNPDDGDYSHVEDATDHLDMPANPAGLTAKGERMYEAIKAGYGRDPRAAEIASRTVLARSRTTPGLKRNPDQRWRVWLAEAPDSYVYVHANGYMDAMRRAARSFKAAHDNEIREMVAKIDGGRAIEELVGIDPQARLQFYKRW